jgi:hypothetical protein
MFIDELLMTENELKTNQKIYMAAVEEAALEAVNAETPDALTIARGKFDSAARQVRIAGKKLQAKPHGFIDGAFLV